MSVVFLFSVGRRPARSSRETAAGKARSPVENRRQFSTSSNPLSFRNETSYPLGVSREYCNFPSFFSQRSLINSPLSGRTPETHQGSRFRQTNRDLRRRVYAEPLGYRDRRRDMGRESMVATASSLSNSQSAGAFRHIMLCDRFVEELVSAISGRDELESQDAADKRSLPELPDRALCSIRYVRSR